MARTRYTKSLLVSECERSMAREREAIFGVVEALLTLRASNGSSSFKADDVGLAMRVLRWIAPSKYEPASALLAATKKEGK